jgi:transcriptional regulator GlxA family with amidase domain
MKPMPEEPSQTDEVYLQALQMIRQRACDGHCVQDVLGALHVSRRTLERSFLAQLGHPPAHEVNLVRLDRAKTLLATTDMAIKRVTALVGFRRTTNFCAFFRRHTGYSPAEYRRTAGQRRGRHGVLQDQYGKADANLSGNGVFVADTT